MFRKSCGGSTVGVLEKCNEWGRFITILVRDSISNQYIIVPGGANGHLWMEFALCLNSAMVRRIPFSHNMVPIRGSMNFREALLGSSSTRNASSSSNYESQFMDLQASWFRSEQVAVVCTSCVVRLQSRKMRDDISDRVSMTSSLLDDDLRGLVGLSVVGPLANIGHVPEMDPLWHIGPPACGFPCDGPVVIGSLDFDNLDSSMERSADFCGQSVLSEVLVGFVSFLEPGTMVSFKGSITQAPSVLPVGTVLVEPVSFVEWGF